MPRTPYDKQAVIKDIAEKTLTSTEISEKYGITIGNVYTIKAAAVRAGIINSRGSKTVAERLKDEESVLTPELREKIKDMRARDLTTTEITNLLKQQGIKAEWEEVADVMGRGVNDYAENCKPHPMKRRFGRVVRG